jgi:hypothetical protein
VLWLASGTAAAAAAPSSKSAFKGRMRRWSFAISIHFVS